MYSSLKILNRKNILFKKLRNTTIYTNTVIISGKHFKVGIEMSNLINE